MPGFILFVLSIYNQFQSISDQQGRIFVTQLLLMVKNRVRHSQTLSVNKETVAHDANLSV